MINRHFAIFTLIFALTSAGTAHAGMFEFVDDIFTFREDQRERVAPRRNLPPRVVYVPHYNQQEATEWSRTYTRPDLVAVDYMPGSASKVMRPAMGEPRGYNQIVRRDQMNRARQMADDNRVYIGEPGTGPAMNQYGAINEIGARTKISQPVADWRDEEGDWRVTARSGDYDYLNQGRQQQAYPAAQHPQDQAWSGQEVTSSDYAEPLRPHQTRPNYPAPSQVQRYGAQNEQGQVTQYGVQRGDTLSGISEQDEIYGNWQLWPLIYDANRGQIQDPDRIYPGQNLGIPRGWSEQDAAAARQRASQKRAPFYPNDGR